MSATAATPAADGAAGVAVEHLVASGELGDTPQLRALVACWVGLIAALRKPPRRRAAVATLADPAEPPDEPIQQPPDPAEDR